VEGNCLAGDRIAATIRTGSWHLSLHIRRGFTRREGGRREVFLCAIPPETKACTSRNNFMRLCLSQNSSGSGSSKSGAMAAGDRLQDANQRSGVAGRSKFDRGAPSGVGSSCVYLHCRELLHGGFDFGDGAHGAEDRIGAVGAARGSDWSPS